MVEKTSEKVKVKDREKKRTVKWMSSFVVLSIVLSVLAASVAMVSAQVPPPPEPTSITVTADPTRIAANGIAESNITAQAMNDGTPSSGYALIFNISSGPSDVVLIAINELGVEEIGRTVYPKKTDDYGYAYATLRAGTTPGIVEVKAYRGVSGTTTVTIGGADTEAPVVTNPNADPQIIPEDTDNVPLWGELSNLSVVVTDESNIVSVTINLSAIGGSAVQPMTRIGVSNVWNRSTNASVGSAIFEAGSYVPHQLRVNATDEHGNSNTSVSIALMVMKNGDASGDGEVDEWDCTYLARALIGAPGYEKIDEVVEVSGDGEVDEWDCTYLARALIGAPGYELK